MEAGIRERAQARPGAAAAAIGLAVAALVLLRLVLSGDAFDRVWAEDGRIFLGDAQRHGVESLAYVYGGYLHTVPRLFALAFDALPLDAYAAAVVVAAAALTGALAAFVYLAAVELGASVGGALIAALAMALAPALGMESLGDLANLHWFLVYAAFWALLLDPGSRLRVVATVVAIAAALSSGIALLLIPAAFAFHRRAALRSWPLRALLVGAVLVLVAHFAGPESPEGIERSPGLYPREFAEGLLGVVGAHTDDAKAAIALRVLLGGVLAAGLAWVWLSAGVRRRWATMAWGTGAAIFVFVLVADGSTAPRYEALLALFVAAGLGLAAVAANRTAVAVAIAAIAALVVINLPADESRVSGPAWQSSVDRLEAECADGAIEYVSVPVSPAGWGTARLACDEAPG